LFSGRLARVSAMTVEMVGTGFLAAWLNSLDHLEE
jgi:hypothetical protein